MKKQRIKNDFYPSVNENLTHELLRRTPEIKGTIFEPTSGMGHISNVLQQTQYNGRFADIITNDIDPKMPSLFHFDAAMPYSRFEQTFPACDWIVSNFPNKLTHVILPNSFLFANRGVALLTRLSFLEPTTTRNKRGNWLLKHADCMRYLHTFSPRPRYRSDTTGSDSVTSSWFVWDKTFSWAALGLEPPFQFVTAWRD